MEVSWGTAAHNSSACRGCEHKDGVATPAQLHLSTARGIFPTLRMGLDSQTFPHPEDGAGQPKLPTPRGWGWTAKTRCWVLYSL